MLGFLEGEAHTAFELARPVILLAFGLDLPFLEYLAGFHGLAGGILAEIVVFFDPALRLQSTAALSPVLLLLCLLERLAASRTGAGHLILASHPLHELIPAGKLGVLADHRHLGLVRRQLGFQLGVLRLEPRDLREEFVD